MTPQEYAARSATQIADLVRSREVSASEICEAALARLDTSLAGLNAITEAQADLARLAAVPANRPARLRRTRRVPPLRTSTSRVRL